MKRVTFFLLLSAVMLSLPNQWSIKSISGDAVPTGKPDAGHAENTSIGMFDKEQKAPVATPAQVEINVISEGGRCRIERDPGRVDIVLGQQVTWNVHNNCSVEVSVTLNGFTHKYWLFFRHKNPFGDNSDERNTYRAEHILPGGNASATSDPATKGDGDGRSYKYDISVFDNANNRLDHMDPQVVISEGKRH